MVTKNMRPQPIKRDFYEELKNAIWKPISYGRFNSLEEEGFITCIENMTRKNMILMILKDVLLS